MRSCYGVTQNPPLGRGTRSPTALWKHEPSRPAHRRTRSGAREESNSAPMEEGGGGGHGDGTPNNFVTSQKCDFCTARAKALPLPAQPPPVPAHGPRLARLPALSTASSCLGAFPLHPPTPPGIS